jgi:hypothetical protein
MLTCIKKIKIKRTYKKKTLQDEDSEILLPSTHFYKRKDIYGLILLGLLVLLFPY